MLYWCWTGDTRACNQSWDSSSLSREEYKFVCWSDFFWKFLKETWCDIIRTWCFCRFESKEKRLNSFWRNNDVRHCFLNFWGVDWRGNVIWCRKSLYTVLVIQSICFWQSSIKCLLKTVEKCWNWHIILSFAFDISVELLGVSFIIKTLYIKQWAELIIFFS